MKKILPFLTLVVLLFGCSKPNKMHVAGRYDFTIYRDYRATDGNTVALDTIFCKGKIVERETFDWWYGVYDIFYTDSDSLRVYYGTMYTMEDDICYFWAHGGYHYNSILGNFIDLKTLHVTTKRPHYLEEPNGINDAAYYYDDIYGIKRF